MTVPDRIAVDEAFVTATLASLVRINSVNPRLDPQAPGEAEIARYVAGVMGDIGLTATPVEPEPGRVSVVGTRAGTGGGRALMLNAHVDTVGVDGMSAPFSGEIRDGRLYGRGAYDMKGSLAACLGAAKALADAGVDLRGDLVVAAVADEEHASLGTASVMERVRVHGAIVTEPTHLRVCLAHKGFVWLRVATAGRAAHGSRHEEGLDANMKMGGVLAELAELERSLRTGRRHPLVGPGTLHAATLRGGTGLSTYAAECELQIERRTIPGETAAQVESEIQEVLDRVAGRDPEFRGSLETLLVREPFEVAANAPIVRAVDGAVQRCLGAAPDHVGDTPWMDSALLAAAGVETVVIGPAGAGAHSAEEWVDLRSVVDLAAILAAAAADYCGI